MGAHYLSIIYVSLDSTLFIVKNWLLERHFINLESRTKSIKGFCLMVPTLRKTPQNELQSKDDGWELLNLKSMKQGPWWQSGNTLTSHL